MRFHVLGLSHAKTHKYYSCDAFSQKVRLICKMLTELGHVVYHYGTAGSEVVCTEHIDVLSAKTFKEVHESYDWKESGEKADGLPLARKCQGTAALYRTGCHPC